MATESASTTVVGGVEEVTEWLTNDGREFYTHLYKAATQPPVATLVLVHGLGEHVDRYESIARTFARNGIQVLGFDQRGFGKTGRRHNRLGDSEGSSAVADDIAFMTKQVSVDGVPHFLFGHSMGGLNALNYCLERNSDGHVRGVIASAPAIIPGKATRAPNFVVAILNQVVKIVPSVQKSTGITTDILTNNQSELDKFNASVDNISHSTLGTLADILQTGKNVAKKAPQFSTPVYLAHADGDCATDYRGTRQFFDNLPEGLDKEYNEISNHPFHEIHFQDDLGFDLIDTYQQWILKHTLLCAGTPMAFDDDLLAELDELGGDFADEHTEEPQSGAGTLTADLSDDDDDDNSAENSADMVALGEASSSGAIGEEHDALIGKLASKSSNIRNVAKLCYSEGLHQLLAALSESQKVPVSEKHIVGRIEDDPEYQLMVRANEMSTRIAGEILVVYRFALDHYKMRFPELETLVRNPVDYARAIKAIGDSTDITKVDFEGILPNATRMVVTVTGSTTAGRLLSGEELERVGDACDCILELASAKSRIVSFIESRMPLIAPNLTAVIGSASAAKLIVEAGGLTALSKIPACNIQVLGKAQHTSTGLSAISTKRHAGIVYYSDVVRSVPEDFRQKMMRKISAKCALAARVDAQHESADGAMGRKFRVDLDAQVAKLLEAAPANAVKPLPVPDEGPKSRRGGRKVRKAREPYTMTELRKQRDRLQFGKFQEEVVVMDEMEGLGMMAEQQGEGEGCQKVPKVHAGAVWAQQCIWDCVARFHASAGL
ncbi:hypothetical protein GQ54DRAFT_303620 [Martensiomyces pterosporus]|nr:hypothetical protein GQ54DRAFT_303620 [Martensiomyces pterosporus]